MDANSSVISHNHHPGEPNGPKVRQSAPFRANPDHRRLGTGRTALAGLSSLLGGLGACAGLGGSRSSRSSGRTSLLSHLRLRLAHTADTELGLP